MDKLKILNPNRIKFARKRRKMTIKALSEILNKTPKTISEYESGRIQPPDKIISLIAEKLQFSKHFFYMDNISGLEKDSISFRSLARMSASIRDSAICAGQIALELDKYFCSKFELPEVTLPNLCNYEPESAAELIRHEWAIGLKSINNIVHLLELKGIRIFSLSEDTLDIDAYSFWKNDQAFIFLNSSKTVERSRFDAAHELCHLLMHKHGIPTGKDPEMQANKFASALLMPQGSVLAETPRIVTVQSIIKNKSIWKVSAMALVKRMSDLNLLSDWKYRSLNIELSRRGFRKKEPNPIEQRETSKIFSIIIRALRDDGITIKDISHELGVNPEEVNALIFNLGIIQISGGANIDCNKSNSIAKNYLSIVE